MSGTKKKILRALLGLAMSAAFVAGLLTLKPQKLLRADVVAEVVAEGELKEEYAVGETIGIPAARLISEGKSYQATRSEIIFPDGCAYEKSEFTIGDAGNYILRYFADGDGVKLTGEKRFTAKYLSFGVTKETAEAKFTDKLLTAQKVADQTEENSYADKSGLFVSLSDASEFVYNEPIDVSSFGLETPVVRIYPYSRSKYVSADGWNVEANKMILKLTDCYDKNNYVEIEISYDPSDTSRPDRKDPYLKAGAANQTRTGFQKASASYNAGHRKSFYIGGQRYVSVTGMYGARDNVNWADNADDTGFEFYYDAATMCVYLKTRKLRDNYSQAGNGEEATHYYVTYIKNNESGAYVFDEATKKYILLSEAIKKNPDFSAETRYDYYGYFLSRERVLALDPDYFANYPPLADKTGYKRDGYTMSGVSTVLIADLDNEEAFDETFKGFTTGEIFLSVYGSDYEENSMRFEIDQIGTKCGEELKLGTVQDLKAPVIKTDERILQAEKRYIVRGQSFKIPEATAYDVNLKGEAKAEVYYAYGTDNELRVGVSSGAFIPKKAGAYTIVYVAEDVFGNKTLLPVTFSALASEKSGTIEFYVQLPEEEVRAGEETQLPAYSFNAINGNETVSVNVYAEYLLTGDRTEIPADTMTAFFRNAGKYKIVFVYGDLFTNYEYDYELNVLPSDNVTFGEIYLPDYFIKGAAYTLDEVSACTYGEEGTKERVADAYVSEDGGEWKKISFESYVVSASDTVRFKYACNGRELLGEKSVPVKDVGYGSAYRMQDYFAGDFRKEAKYNGIELISEANSGDAAVQFINALSLDAFSMQFGVPAEASSFAALEIRLTDFYDRSHFVTLTYRNGATSVEFNGRTAEGGFTDTRMISYYSAKASFGGQAGESYAFKNNFASDRVLLSVTLKEISGSAGVFIRSINGQSLSQVSYDYGEPTICYNASAKGIRKLNEVVEILPGQPSDVLSPYDRTKLVFTMKTPSGEYAVAEDGTKLDASCDAGKTYYVKLSSYGDYVVNYKYTDGAGNSKTISYKIRIADENAPVIVIDDGYNEKTTERVKVGDVVTIKGYSVSDDMSSSDKIKSYVLVYTANGEMKAIVNGSFKAEEKGEYIVMYCAYDESGNYSSAYYIVTAE